MPVHLHGIPADMDAFTAIGEAHDLIVLEDAAQAQGSEWRGRKVGTLGHFGSFSYQRKTMVSGDGGMVTTDDKALADLCRSYRQFGSPQEGAEHTHAHHRADETELAFGRDREVTEDVVRAVYKVVEQIAALKNSKAETP